ncbi:helix-turn-helix domain-containing protein [Clostridium kluyveri]|jgi:Zn-dependent peptidase ImmA (M78 family)/DNA-binding XRE family transcriptional regulator|uniref:Predicted transcriptional regulator with an addtional conserved domain n=2 Tax=Clostridium kluyveri TaxID=1534 RepID=A5MYI9_CLOK5|nr:XRE family transcriptional regulator [Clostridium kluyveri]EDK33863.1 Predicted transcriptional regulator with an addtional conserved domain [Clostridium kluyveri DSM 555]EDK33935.1 Predicted transcriptional regulator with an addtional conserved domain [Clostridium kluyveri DSM 555]
MVKNNFDIVPARIKEARESRGLSMSELSELIEVTSQAISQYEKGIMNPSVFVLKKMSNALNFPIQFFYKSENERTCENSAIFFRAMKSTPKKIKNAYSYYIKWADDIYKYLNKYINFYDVNLPDISNYTYKEPIDNKTIEEIALYVRKYWNLGDNPIHNMVDLLETNGIIICRIKFKNKKIDAFSQWNNGKGYIFLGSEKGSAVRSRFDAAHELGHLLLHPTLKINDVYKKDVLNRIEAEANYFAGAFLMPITSFPTEIIHNSVDYLLMLKEKWKVSVNAMIMRSKQLNLFTDNQISYLQRQMTLKQMWKHEPLDDILQPEEPSIFKEAFELLFDNKILHPEQTIQDICLNKEDIQSICCLPDEIFKMKPKQKKLELKIIK